MPVVLHMDGYAGGKAGMGSDIVAAAQYYGFVVFSIGNNLKDGRGGFGLQFGNDGVANDDNPTPCSSRDSREIEFLRVVFDFIADSPTLLDASKVFTEGFSQNSMFAVYTAVCFADKVAGTWQGGSGQARTGSNPVVPGFQAQCSFPSYASHGRGCCNYDFCSQCQYWPLWPKTCSNKIVDCIATYTDDNIACGTDWYMYEAMTQEGNDARLLSFPVPAGDSSGGHRSPKNKWAWVAGCLGIAPQCSSSCATSFHACVDGASDGKSYDKFATCEKQLKAGLLSGCTVGCAPTLSMLQRSESPVVTLSEGNFGLETGLPAAGGSAPKPNCKKPFGPFSTGPGPRPKCTPPSNYTAPPISPKDTC
uniref:Feruloyl esterase n=2 Tax=Alexandrium monilatum TaxID=311494 RepID=A0A7S4SMA8_9DINO